MKAIIWNTTEQEYTTNAQNSSLSQVKRETPSSLLHPQRSFSSILHHPWRNNTCYATEVQNISHLFHICRWSSIQRECLDLQHSQPPPWWARRRGGKKTEEGKRVGDKLREEGEEEEEEWGNEMELRHNPSSESWGPLCCLSVTKLCPTLRLHRLQCLRLPCPSLSPSLFKIKPTELIMPSNHLILCGPLLLLLSTIPSIRVFWMSQLFTSAGQSIGASASASVLLMNIQGFISFRIDWFDIFSVQGTLKSLL